MFGGYYAVPIRYAYTHIITAIIDRKMIGAAAVPTYTHDVTYNIVVS